MTRIAAIASLTSATTNSGWFYYPLTNTSSDPTYTGWRSYNMYTFVPNDGIYTPKPITLMGQMFRNNATFNDPDISSWDVSSATAMTYMFSGASAFNQDLSSWDVSSVINMAYMFSNALAFNQDISGWNVSNVTRMDYMFFNTSVFNQDLSSWNISSVTSIASMFNQTVAFNNGGVALNWGNKTANVDNMSQVFRLADAFNQDVSSWDVSSVINMQIMFYQSPFNNGGVALNWGNKTANVQNMSTMFRETPFNQDISGWNVGSVTDMGNMFRSATAFDQNISGWNVNNVTTAIGFSISATQKGQNWTFSQHPSNAGLGNFYNL